MPADVVVVVFVLVAPLGIEAPFGRRQPIIALVDAQHRHEHRDEHRADEDADGAERLDAAEHRDEHQQLVQPHVPLHQPRAAASNRGST